MSVLIHIFRVVIIIFLVLQIRVVHPSAEVAGLVSSTLSSGESGLGVGIVAHGVGASEQVSSDFSIALVHQVFIYHSSVVAGVAWDVLLPNHVGGT